MCLTDRRDGVHQCRKPLQRIVFTLHRDDDALRCHQRVEGQHVERRRAVNNDEVITVLYLCQQILEATFSLVHLQQFYFGSHQVAVCRQHVKACLWRSHSGLIKISLADQHIVNGVFQLSFIYTTSHGGIALRVHVDQQYFAFGSLQGCSQIDRSGCFSYATFLVGDCQYFCHLRHLRECQIVGFCINSISCRSPSQPGTDSGWLATTCQSADSSASSLSG